MKSFYILILLVLVQNCSFDNKSGIWNNENLTKKENDLFKEFETLTSTKVFFDKIIPHKSDFKFKIDDPINNNEWNDVFYNQENNLKNFKYNNNNNLIFKSKKITRQKLNNYILFENNNFITSDEKGNLIILSKEKNKIITKFNFYKKKHKKIKKKLNFIIEKNIVYVSDNIGYLYAFDYIKNKIIWAKNIKIPFRSNLKLASNNLITSDQNNILYFINKITGDIIKRFPTEETVIKNQFINNLSLSNNSLFFLNTYGTLYSIDLKTLKINWFIYLNQSSNLNPNNLFSAKEIINHKGKIVVSSNQSTFIISAESGIILDKKNISSIVRPIILNGYLFLITKNNLLISIDINDGKILYSHDINEKIASFLNIKKKKVFFKNITFVNSNIFIFLNNSYLLNFKINGSLQDVNKLPTKIQSEPIFINQSIIFIDKKNKLSIIN